MNLGRRVNLAWLRNIGAWNVAMPGEVSATAIRWDTMLVLHSGSGAQDVEVVEGEVLEASDLDEIFFTATRLLTARAELEAAALLLTTGFGVRAAQNHFGDEFEVLHATVSLEHYEHLRIASQDDSYRRSFGLVADAVNEIARYVHVRHVVVELERVVPPRDWHRDFEKLMVRLTANQALFSFQDASKIRYQGLNFRSRTEIRVFDKLVSAGLLVFPLPVSVMGAPRTYKEPDFVVVKDGKVGILEIHGDKWHPPETAAKEHERRREFTALGIGAYEIFDAKRCQQDPAGVVAEFLKAMERA